MKRQRCFYSEAAYAVGIVVLAFGTALMEKADFGMSMIVAPAYLIHLKLSQVLPFYTFGMSEYVFQALLLAVLSVVMGRFKRSYLLSFATAILYGLILDVMMGLIAPLPCAGMLLRTVFYSAGLLACTLAVAMLFRTYLPPEAYELFVKEIAEKHGFSIGRTKTVYDFSCCALAVALSFAFYGFGVFVGISWGTVVCTLLNGWLIGLFSKWLENSFVFRDAFPLRKYL